MEGEKTKKNTFLVAAYPFDVLPYTNVHFYNRVFVIQGLRYKYMFHFI